MTDKEQINDSLKNSNKNFNENYTHNKNQITINGKIYNACYGCELWDGHHCTADRSYEFNGKSHRIICDKHMAHQYWKVYHELFYRTQECEELKDYAKRQENQRETYYREFLKRNKALEEIEEICLRDRVIKDVCLVSTCFEEDRVMYDIQEEILNIINKAKGEGND